MEQDALTAAQQIVNEAEAGIAIEPEAAVAAAELIVQEAPEVAPPIEVAPPVEIEPAIAAAEALAEPDAEPEEELTFAQALEQFEQRQATDDNEDNPEDDERTRKLKEDRRKRQTLVFDAKLGKVVAQKKHKGGKEDWLDSLEEEEEEDEVVAEEAEAEE